MCYAIVTKVLQSAVERFCKAFATTFVALWKMLAWLSLLRDMAVQCCIQWTACKREKVAILFVTRPNLFNFTSDNEASQRGV